MVKRNENTSHPTHLIYASRLTAANRSTEIASDSRFVFIRTYTSQAAGYLSRYSHFQKTKFLFKGTHGISKIERFGDICGSWGVVVYVEKDTLSFMPMRSPSR